MKIYFNDSQNSGFNSTEIINVFDYIIDLTKTHESSGKFLYLNLLDKCLSIGYGYGHKNPRGITISERFYDYLDILSKLGVLDITEEHDEGKARRYCISKEMFILTYSALCAINSFNKKQIVKTFGKGSHLTMSTLLDITTGIYSAIGHDYFYINTKLKNLVYLIYGYSYMFCINMYLKNTLSSNDEVIPLVKYLSSLDIELLNGIAPVRASTFNKLRTKQYHLDKPVYITKEWFTDTYYGELNSLEETDRLYWRSIRSNPLLKPIVFKLEDSQNNIDLDNIEIDKDTLNKLPGSTTEMKQSLMERIVRYHSISRYPLLRYAMEIVDNIVRDEDNYHMKVNIKTRKYGNKYGTNKYLVHPSSRLYNFLCSFKKAEHCDRYEDSREYFLSKEGITGYYDITGTIFTLAFSLNNHIPLDLTYDIKQKIADMKITGYLDNKRIVLDDRKYFKLMMFYMFFLDEDTAYECYKNRFNRKYFELENIYGYDPEFLNTKYGEAKETLIKTVPDISEYDFRKIYRYIQESTGGTLKYKNNIFVIESAIEALVVYYFKSKGIRIYNVFDCFFYDEDEITEEFLRKIIVRCANMVFARYYELINRDRYSWLINDSSEAQAQTSY